jgi:succinate-semialdehyde dehydrogenase/glutarate-semialdehyde dehydrogenase
MDIKQIHNILQKLSKKCYINGELEELSEYEDIFDPANDESIGQMGHATPEDVNRAADFAYKAFLEINNIPSEQRSKILLEWAQKIEESKDILAYIITLEQGKTLKESYAEIKYALSYIKYYANIQKESLYYDIGQNNHFKSRLIKLEPVGVTAAITPWNFPLAIYVRKFSACFAAGCSMIVKPSQYTPFSALYSAVLWHETESPKASLQIITGQAEILSKSISSNKIIKKVSFTGSTRVGRIIAGNSANNIQRIALELGGNSPFIIFKDADIDLAVQMTMDGKFRNNGQSCTAINRVLIDKSIAEEYEKKLSSKIVSLKVGNGLYSNVDLGPLFDSNAVKRINKLLAQACENGARIVAEGIVDPDVSLIDNSAYLAPKLLINCNEDMDLFKEEIFGPIIAVTTFETEEQALELANSTDYGLASYICGKNTERNNKFANLLDFALVGINSTFIQDAEIPFGGVKNSGYGREGSKEGLMEYLQTKTIFNI